MTKGAASGPRSKRGSAKKRIMQHWQLYAIIAVPLAVLIIFKYVPMLGLQIAFRNYTARGGIWNSAWVGLKHFKQFFSSPSTGQIIWNTVIISLYSIAASFPFAIILAVALNEAISQKFKKAVQMVTYAPYFISTVVLVSMLNQLLDPRIGVINLALQNVGIDIGNIVGQPGAFIHLYVWSGIWQTTGYNAILYLAALTSINPELVEAAVMDGCNKFQRIWYVDMPSLIPTAVTLLILNMGYVMSVGFEKIYLMQVPATLSVSEVVSTYVYRVGIINSDFSYSTAIGLVNSMINLGLILLVNTIAKRMSDTSLF